jgi:peptidoglycan biosynthesis protein MviN/MurJ (putative lipid II flippase)
MTDVLVMLALLVTALGMIAMIIVVRAIARTQFSRNAPKRRAKRKIPLLSR